ncbi:right-handed parallel beta-helix repeat-containing protein [Planctomycetota bacterium]
METRTTCTTRSPASTRQCLKSVLMVALGVVIAVGAPVRATTPIVATGDPSTDFEAIQSALDAGGEVILRNGPGGEIFNLEGINKSLSITANVTLRGQDDAVGNKARIRAYNSTLVPTPWGDESLAISVNNSGGTVELENLDIESNARRIILIGDVFPLTSRDVCKDFTIRDCNIVGTHGEASCIETWSGVTGTLYLEGNHILGHWCAGDWASWFTTYMSSCQWEVYSNTLVGSNTCLAAVTSKGIKFENNRCEGPVILTAQATQGEIVIKNNIMIQSGHNVFEGNNAAGLFVSHWEGFSGGEISGNTIDMNPSEAVEITGVLAITLADYLAFRGAHGLLVQDNTITGQADAAIWLDNGACDNIIRRNNIENFTAVRFSVNGAAQMAVAATCHDNVFRGNIIGSLGSGAFAAVACWGDNNDFIRNDYTQSNAPGLAVGGIPCVWLANSYDPDTGNLAAEPENNLVFEANCLPPGTTVAEQVLDDPRKQTGSTTNIVVGH